MMKRVRPIALLALTCFPFQSVFAKLSVSIDCPNKFIATVTELQFTTSQAPFSAMEKVSVHAHVDKIKQGKVKKEINFKVLKHGPTKFVKGKRYELSMRNGLICKMKPI